MSNCILVPIKTNNKRLPGKTFRPLAGKPLYSYLFDTLMKVKASRTAREVYVYSSDKTILSLAEDWGFSPLKQPPEYDTTPSVTGDFLIEKVIPDIEEVDVIGWLHITTPFLTPATIRRAVSSLENSSELDSVFGITPRYNRFWYGGKPVNHDTKKLIRTQDLTPVYEEADFYFFRRESFRKYGKRVCGNFQTIEVDRIEAVDIDCLEDLLYAEALIKSGLVPKR